jgi:hypothetical protein
MGVAEQTNRAVRGLANIVTSASAALPNADPTPSALIIDPGEKTRSVIDRLLDLQIPDSLKDWLATPLKSLGLEIDKKEVKGSFNSPPRFYTVIKNAASERALWNVPKDVLQDDSKWESIGGVMMALRIKNQTIVAVSEDLENPHPAYEVYKKTWTEIFGITWKFVPWGSLQTIKSTASLQQSELLSTFFELSDLITQGQQSIDKRISDNDVVLIAAIVARVKDFIDDGEKAWRLYMEQAGLKQLTGKLSFSGPPKTAAFGVFSQLQDMSPLPDYPLDSVLGRLLCQLQLIADMEQADKAAIRAIIKTHNLAPSFFKD